MLIRYVFCCSVLLCWFKLLWKCCGGELRVPTSSMGKAGWDMPCSNTALKARNLLGALKLPWKYLPWSLKSLGFYLCFLKTINIVCIPSALRLCVCPSSYNTHNFLLLTILFIFEVQLNGSIGKRCRISCDPVNGFLLFVTADTTGNLNICIWPSCLDCLYSLWKAEVYYSAYFHCTF